jgi:phosphate/phosphite/phosphonate ABC transporter binding protein
MKRLKLTYYPWITQHISEQEIRDAVNTFATEVEKTLKAQADQQVDIEVLKPVSVQKQVEMIERQQCDIALMNPLGYVFARKRNSSVEAIAVALRIIDGEIGHTYFAQIYTNKKTAIRNLEDLRGKSFGFGYPYSTSAFLVPAYWMHQKGLHPFAIFSRIEFLGNHDLVAKAVYEERVDAGAGHDGAILDLGRQYGYGDAEDRLVQLARSDPIHSDPVVVHITDNNLKSLLTKALISASKTNVGKRALAIFWGNAQGLDSTQPTDYTDLETSLADLRLTEKDLLR